MLAWNKFLFVSMSVFGCNDITWGEVIGAWYIDSAELFKLSLLIASIGDDHVALNGGFAQTRNTCVYICSLETALCVFVTLKIVLTLRLVSKYRDCFKDFIKWDWYIIILDT